MDVLCATFGNPDYYDRLKDTIWNNTFNKLVIVYDKGEDSAKEFQDVLKSFQKRSASLDLKESPRNDFWGAYETMNWIWEKYQKENLIFDISGGSKLLSMAALLCAFNHGVPTKHYEEGVSAILPVYKGLNIDDRYNEDQKEVLKMVKDGMAWKTLEAKLIKFQDEVDKRPKKSEDAKEHEDPRFRYNVHAVFGKLRKDDLVELERKGKESYVKLTETGSVVQRYYS